MTRNSIQRTTTGVAAALALLVGAAAADATPMTVDFSVTSNDVANPSYGTGGVGTGYFTFDDSLIPAGGSGRVGNPIVALPTLDFFFSWFGVSFDESNAAIATLTFADGALTDWMVGGSYLPASCGFLRYACTSSGGLQADFDGFGSGGMAFTDAKRPGLAYGNPVEWSVRATSVPEPGTLALFGLGALGMACVRRRRLANGSRVAATGCGETGFGMAVGPTGGNRRRKEIAIA